MSENPYVGAPYARGSDTSREAAEQVVPRAARMRTLVLDQFRRAGDGGLADHELEALLGMTSSRSARPRRVELVRDGYLELTELRRRTPNGRWAGVYRLASTGSAS